MTIHYCNISSVPARFVQAFHQEMRYPNVAFFIYVVHVLQNTKKEKKNIVIFYYIYIYIK